MTTLVRFNPTRELTTMRNDMDKLFNAFFNAPATNNTKRSWGLALDVTEDKEAFNIIASVPGFSRDEIDITVDDGVLKISGEVKVDESEEASEEAAKVRYHLRERRTGRFSRNLRLPKDINVDEITATHENGVLTLRLPKTPEVQPKRISIS